MTSAPAQVERRIGQRFPFQLPVSLRAPASGAEGMGCTLDISCRGVFFLTGAALRENDEVELTLTMPAEITLGQNMRVRCRGRVLRLVKAAEPKGHDELRVETESSAQPRAVETKIGVAVRLDGYEYLSDSPSLAVLPRVAGLHPRREDEAPFHPR
jgi:hypothetical protein